MGETFDMEVFRAGDYGPGRRFSEADVRRIAASYDRSVHEAPITVDHTKSGPAWGWVRGLKAAGAKLVATVGQMPEAFRELVRGGRYKKRSAEIYPSFTLAGGEPYLRAVTFLGARPPEVKGLAEVALAEAESDDVVRVAFTEGARTTGLGGDEVKAFTEEQLKAAIDQAVQEATEPLKLQIQELEATAKPGGPAVAAAKEFAELEGQIKALQDELKGAKETLAEERAGRTAMLADARRREVVSFCEAQEAAGKLTPAARKAGLVEFMVGLSTEKTVTFGEGDAAVKTSPAEFFQQFLESLPEALPTGRVAGRGGPGTEGGAKPWAEISAEFAEGKEVFEASGITLAEYAKLNYGVEPPK